MLTEMRETGQQIVNNLENNLYIRKTKYIQCIDCGEWVEVDMNSKRIRCDRCYKEERRLHNKKMYQNRKIQPS